MRKILVVEDTESHRKDAEEFFSTLEGVEVTFAVNFCEGLLLLKEKNWGAVITDIFMPLGDESPYNKVYIYEELLAINTCWVAVVLLGYDYTLAGDERTVYGQSMDWLTGKVGIAPYGALLAKKAKERGIPTVTISSLGHHDAVSRFHEAPLRNLGIESVTGHLHGEVEHKSWSRAWERISKP